MIANENDLLAAEHERNHAFYNVQINMNMNVL